MIDRLCGRHLADCLFCDLIRVLVSPVSTCGPTVSAMTEPPRPPGEGNPSDPTRPINPYPGNDPGSAPPPPPAYGSPQPPSYGTPPPTSGAGGYPPPSSG